MDWPGAPKIDELPQVSALEAFDAVRAFIEAYWERVQVLEASSGDPRRSNHLP
jgi:hypothetical protein